MNRLFKLALAVCAGSSLSLGVRAAPLFSDNFNTTGSAANYNIFQTTAPVVSALGLSRSPSITRPWVFPRLPNSGDSTTLGLRVQSDQTANTTSDLIGAISVATKSLSLPSAYKVQVDVWGNYIGGTTINDANGTNGSTGATIATGVKGTTYDSATTNGTATEGGFLTDSIRDATSAGGTYRVYLNAVNTANTAGRRRNLCRLVWCQRQYGRAVH